MNVENERDVVERMNECRGFCHPWDKLYSVLSDAVAEITRLRTALAATLLQDHTP